MTARPTLNSRLRVLVAKTFRAEKLYSSIRNSRADKFAGVTTLSEIANDIRAKEWQRAHYKLRTALNDILMLGSSAEIVAEVVQLREYFLQKVEESSAALEHGSEAVIDTVQRSEFAHSFRISVELIRHKACVQANKVIAEELSALLEASGRSAALDSASRTVGPIGPAPSSSYVPAAEGEAEATAYSNVIPLRRRFAAGTRRGH